MSSAKHQRQSSVLFHENGNTIIELSDEKDQLVYKEYRSRKSSSRPRISSVFFMVDSKFAGGIVSRINYMTRCFTTAWEWNKADTPKLHMLLWNGQTSQQTLWKSALVLLVQWTIPLLSLILLLGPVQHLDWYKILSWILLVLNSSLFVWYLVVLHIIIRNRRNWKNAWFTFRVPTGTIGLVESGDSCSELTLFHFSANIRFIKANFLNISRLHTISRHEQEHLKQNMKYRGLEVSEIILYTEDFLSCYNSWPKYMTLGLTLVSFCSMVLILLCLSMVKS